MINDPSADNVATPKPSRMWFVVPAAGIGQRMAADRPKQYLPLAGTTVLECTLETLLRVKGVEGVVVAIHPDDTYWPQSVLAHHDKITTVVGGAQRCDSVLAALNSLEGQLSDNDWVLVHDAARPCVQVDNLYQMIDALLGDEVGGILGVPCSDTVKRVDGNMIKETLDRREIWQAQTPQMFRYHILRLSLMHCLNEGLAITDEASAVEKIGYSVKMIQGRSDNIKITHPDDLRMAELILAR
jgi:2-C-methyl-D-erythritol 4-phosphate cytidylyltransferase